MPRRHCVFDPERIDRGPIEMRADLPSGAERLTAEAEGIAARVRERRRDRAGEGELTGATPGTVLRSGRDTETVLAV